ncbi:MULTISPECIES: intradiol ring-cleavage dioxygenase [unclassified Rhodococcus (in: high G+C Gram-positive bacteria)]|uniref:intradiol ring-cleavage dioxygenase n=1 Tax=unclassified Rhodococcus (in: high G+C Gram-positive bacteria) TaxID=192944 RepID=UPI000B9ADD46|nr:MULTISPECIES: intradiol ring-cleavage dioxygenase [unclassified Rhodococcus (in: high G+C Gram-positive bacteria)]OZE34110.1 3,4-dioxygenase subunit beta [Rhodococcus sp. 05-2254-4]OZE51308.1 3,4-dioxygenase subunit beta [Rhodococcus sp. 05-2254-3]OZE52959.1 3,4-dioxygenase subunit beta [Rhodococcus sp. 05-2254-2]
MARIPEPTNTSAGPAYEGRLLDRPAEDVVDQGARFDMTTLVTRRRVLSIVGAGAGAVALAACSSTSNSGSATATTATASSTATAATSEIPDETNGPYPADGSNGVNVLEESGIVRRDITSSLDGGTTVSGVPLSLNLTLTDMANDNRPFENAAVYMWQCDAAGLYSMYSEGVEDETYLRGIQAADANGTVTFDTIVPGCYSGRWTHIHFEVYPDAASATTADNAIATSQIAFPQDMLDAIYQLDTYPSSAQNLAQLGSIDNDNVFGDGYELQMGSFSGDSTAGYVGSLAVAIDTTTEPTAGAAPSGGGGGQSPMGGGTPPAGGPPNAGSAPTN